MQKVDAVRASAMDTLNQSRYDKVTDHYSTTSQLIVPAALLQHSPSTQLAHDRVCTMGSTRHVAETFQQCFCLSRQRYAPPEMSITRPLIRYPHHPGVNSGASYTLSTPIRPYLGAAAVVAVGAGRLHGVHPRESQHVGQCPRDM